jgi:hypothetical protein
VRALSPAIAAALIVGAAYPATAQTGGGASGSPRIEISGGGAFAGGFSQGERTAQLTSNTGTLGTPSTFFVTDSQIQPAFGALGRIGFFVTPSFAVEGGVRITRPTFETSISDDVEDAAEVQAQETVTQYLFDGSAVWHFGRADSGARTLPFIFAGAGYLRELHEEGSLVEEGTEYHAGAGVKWGLGSGGAIGVRAEVAISIRDGGVDVEDKRRVLPVAAGSIVWRF